MEKPRVCFAKQKAHHTTKHGTNDRCENLKEMKEGVKTLESKMETDKKYFDAVYKFTFTYNLQEGQRVLGMFCNAAHIIIDGLTN